MDEAQANIDIIISKLEINPTIKSWGQKVMLEITEIVEE